jgi:CRISPR-associated protein Csx10
MKVKIKLISDVVFGNGESVPGGEDIAVLNDAYGFPYYKGGTFKGIFREELDRYLGWNGFGESERKKKIKELLGNSGDDDFGEGKLIFSDFCLSDAVRASIIKEIGCDKKQDILDALTHLRMFTSIDENGMTKQGSLRIGRCVNKGLYFYSEIKCRKEDEEMVSEVLAQIKAIGTMRSRGFGRVKVMEAE